jgi:hypothetical protein
MEDNYQDYFVLIFTVLAGCVCYPYWSCTFEANPEILVDFKENFREQGFWFKIRVQMFVAAAFFLLAGLVAALSYDPSEFNRSDAGKVLTPGAIFLTWFLLTEHLVGIVFANSLRGPSNKGVNKANATKRQNRKCYSWLASTALAFTCGYLVFSTVNSEKNNENPALLFSLAFAFDLCFLSVFLQLWKQPNNTSDSDDTATPANKKLLEREPIKGRIVHEDKRQEC